MAETGSHILKTDQQTNEHFCIHPENMAPGGKTLFLTESCSEVQKASDTNMFKFTDVSEAVKISVDVDNVFLPIQTDHHKAEHSREQHMREHLGQAHCDQLQANCDIDHNLMHFGSDCIHNVHNIHLDHFLIPKSDSSLEIETNSFHCPGMHTVPTRAKGALYFPRGRQICCNTDGRCSRDGRFDRQDLQRKRMQGPKPRRMMGMGNESHVAHEHCTQKRIFPFESSFSEFQGMGAACSKRQKLGEDFVGLALADGQLEPPISPMMNLPSGPHLCRFCLKPFTSQMECSAHEECHTGTKPFECELCGKTFKHETHLVQHSHTHAGEEEKQQQQGGGGCMVAEERRAGRKKSGKKPFKCQQCGKSFMQEVNLAQHVKTHSCHKPYRCEYCGKSFAKTICLKQHINTHTGEKPFKCRYCTAAFSHSGSLYHHEKGQHKPEGAKIKPK